ncbi:N-hydroxyarylamine O-acetyltransferase [Labilithrix luteola]|uniref:N-hydroxyarylamine O-acetyltransferase n=1 Tax=Labilithrix luteola TaxID=1391654 RepID=A0A0K1PJU8_9BACT|nr:arylamine N-acetyltransferase [Labilithrix luteola]AKU93813.1 N-hydroxyarylamine O-acetyltransferase [Labilithrix luteola]
MALSPVDLEAYLSRVGYRGSKEPTLATLHALTAAHTRSIPFENLDVLLGRPIRLEPDAVLQKLVHERRGGYCFEQNGLFLEVLATLGFQVAPLSARVRLQRPRDFVPARTHLFVRVELDGESWLTDVGVGGVSLTSAIRLQTDIEQPTPHEPRRIIRDGALWFHQVRFGDEWNDVYDFTLEEMPHIDREVANWYTSTHPTSHFKDRLMAARAGDDGERLTVAGREFSIRARHGQATKHAISSRAELLDILDRHFGIRLPPDSPLEVPGAPWPS